MLKYALTVKISNIKKDSKHLLTNANQYNIIITYKVKCNDGN